MVIIDIYASILLLGRWFGLIVGVNCIAIPVKTGVSCVQSPIVAHGDWFQSRGLGTEGCVGDRLVVVFQELLLEADKHAVMDNFCPLQCRVMYSQSDHGLSCVDWKILVLLAWATWLLEGVQLRLSSFLVNDPVS